MIILEENFMSKQLRVYREGAKTEFDYQILWEEDFTKLADAVKKLELSCGKICIVADDTVGNLYGKEAQKALEAGECAGQAVPELREIVHTVKKTFPDVNHDNFGVGSTIFAVKPGDGSAREQAASCQKVLGGWANIANEYATKRYRSNLINWGMLPFLIPAGDLPFKNGDYLFVPAIRQAIIDKTEEIQAYVVKEGQMQPFTLQLGALTDDERDIILKGCLINYYRG